MCYDTKQTKQKNLISHLWRMPENQLLILKAGKYRREQSIYPASPIWTVFQGNQVVYQWKFQVQRYSNQQLQKKTEN